MASITTLKNNLKVAFNGKYVALVYILSINILHKPAGYIQLTVILRICERIPVYRKNNMGCVYLVKKNWGLIVNTLNAIIIPPSILAMNFTIRIKNIVKKLKKD